MAEGSKWTPGKIFLLVLGILAGLGILCCGAGYLLMGDKIKSAIAIGKDMASFMGTLQKELGSGTAFQLVPNGNAKFILVVGVEGELTPERVADVQDKTWKLFADAFKTDGFMTITHVAVGKPEKGGRASHQEVSDWAGHQISLADIVKRTGIAAPPISSIMPKDGGVVVQVDGESDAPKDDKKDEGDNGGGTGGK
jgi:hypothetical protein